MLHVQISICQIFSVDFISYSLLIIKYFIIFALDRNRRLDDSFFFILLCNKAHMVLNQLRDGLLGNLIIRFEDKILVVKVLKHRPYLLQIATFFGLFVSIEEHNILDFDSGLCRKCEPSIKLSFRVWKVFYDKLFAFATFHGLDDYLSFKFGGDLAFSFLRLLYLLTKFAANFTLQSDKLIKVQFDKPVVIFEPLALIALTGLWAAQHEYASIFSLLCCFKQLDFLFKTVNHLGIHDYE